MKCKERLLYRPKAKTTVYNMAITEALQAFLGSKVMVNLVDTAWCHGHDILFHHIFVVVKLTVCRT